MKKSENKFAIINSDGIVWTDKEWELLVYNNKRSAERALLGLSCSDNMRIVPVTITYEVKE
jgi:hypothetical protein